VLDRISLDSGDLVRKIALLVLIEDVQRFYRAHIYGNVTCPPCRDERSNLVGCFRCWRGSQAWGGQ
jgi:hypothetical protein